jgi:hypothetical protein
LARPADLVRHGARGLFWEVAKFLAILVLVLLALFFLAILLLDRPRK